MKSKAKVVVVGGGVVGLSLWKVTSTLSWLTKILVSKLAGSSTSGSIFHSVHPCDNNYSFSFSYSAVNLSYSNSSGVFSGVISTFWTFRSWIFIILKLFKILNLFKKFNF